MHMDVWPVCTSVYHIRVWCPQRSEEGVRLLVVSHMWVLEIESCPLRRTMSILNR